MADPDKTPRSPSRSPEITTLQALLPELEGKTAIRKNTHPPETLAWPSYVMAKLGGRDGYPKSKPPSPIIFRRGLQYFKSPTYG